MRQPLVTHRVLCGLLATVLAVGAAVPAMATASERSTASELRDWIELVRLARYDGPALRPLVPEQTIVSISAHVSPELVSLLVEKLSDDATLKRIGLDRPAVNQLLGGLALLGPLLEEIEPHVQIVVARQTYPDIELLPEARLPAVALVFRPRDMSRAKRMLLSAYLVAMQRANETARAEGRALLRMESVRRGEGFYAASTFRLPRDAGPELDGLADYNLSPSIAVVGERMILASSRELVLELVDLASAESGDLLIAEKVRVDVGPVSLVQLAADNLPALAAQRDSALLARIAGRVESTSASTVDRLPRRRVTLRWKPLRLPKLVRRSA